MANRSTAQRKADTLASLDREVDAWVTSASADGEAYLIPLSYVWDGQRLIFATLERSITSRNLLRAGRARVALPSVRDVVIIDGAVAFTPIVPGVDPSLAEPFAAHVDWDPRGETEPYVFITVTPERIQAWRDAAEISGRTVMKGGVWQDDDGA